MKPERWRRVKELFQQAIERPLDERDAFIAGAAPDDEALRREVLTLLSSHDSASEFLNEPPSGVAAEVSGLTAGSRVGERLGAYKILRLIGRGGTGSAYLAVRDDDEFQRRVAIKLVRRGMATADILRRFRSERQILAAIDHPNIARLLDGGSTDDGHPYFVMEHIEGEPITTYCDRNRLSIAHRLQLFCEVCAAVQVAHRNLVVHRDIKPGNILISADGVPKLLDFGIAKLLNPELSAGPYTPTVPELRVMTPEYASPEQMRGGAVTTASDVYSLGVLLYELLAGRRPYQLDNLPMSAMESIVSTTRPSRPSDAVQTDAVQTDPVQGEAAYREAVPSDAAPGFGVPGDATPGAAGPARDRAPENRFTTDVAGARGETPDRLRRTLAGDLDNIVLMALRKEPDRRYSSVDLFANDIRPHLRGLPVTARADTLGYRVAKFVGRHRLAVAVGCTVALSGLVLGATIVVQAGRVASERDRAERSAERATAVSGFLQEIMASPDPIEGAGRDVTVIESVERAVPRIASTFAHQPELQAAVRHTIGRTFARLGRLTEAEEQLRSALELRRSAHGAANLDVAATLNSLGEVIYDRGDTEGSEQLFREALDMREELLGREHADVAEALDNLANTVHEGGDLGQAETMYREVLRIRRAVLSAEHEDVASSLNNLATVHHDRGELDDAERLYRESLALSQAALGGEHPDVATSLSNLAALLLDRGESAEAEPLLRRALAINRDRLGDRHPGVVNSLENQAALLDEGGDADAARELFLESLQTSRLIWGDSLRVVDTLTSLAHLELRSERPDVAEPYFVEALELSRRMLEADSPELSWLNAGYGYCLLKLNRHQQSECTLLAVLATEQQRVDPDRELVVTVATDLIALYEALGRGDQVERYRTMVAAGEADGALF